jgi:ketosteroid isomerase-like protein
VIYVDRAEDRRILGGWRRVMQRNAEVEAAVEAFVADMRRGDAAAVTEQLSVDFTTVIGTDDVEWWDGHDAAASAFRAQMETLGGLPLKVGDVRGYAIDGVGWFEDHGTMGVADDQSVPVRMTGVLRQEEGGWRLLQLHLSVGTPNAEMGLEL